MIYLNNASTTFPKPQCVIDAINKNLAAIPTNYGRMGINRGDKDILNDTRLIIKQILNAGAEYYNVITSGSTESLNLAIKGLDLIGKNVIITATEHNSVIRPLKYLEKKGDISITVVPCNEIGHVDPNEIKNAITNKTALICVNHVSNVTGSIQNVRAISDIAKAYDILLLIDGSQSAGVIPIDFDEFSPDLFAYTGHKSLYGIQGTGGLLFKTDLKLKPFKHGGTGTLSYLTEQPDEFPSKYESGTMNIPGITALETGAKWTNEIGINKIHNKKKSMIEYLVSALSKKPAIKLYYDKINSSGSVLSFTIDGISPQEINYILTNSFGISIRSGLHCASLIHNYLGTYPEGTARVSPSYFTTDEDLDKLISAVIKIADSTFK